MSVDHWMSFGTFGEQRYFVYPTKDAYQGVIINGNMAAHAPEGLAAFLLERTAQQDYVIDPLTHAFQHSPSAVKTTNTEGEKTVKTSIRKLAEAYGNPFRKIVGEKPLLPKMLGDKGLLREFVSRCLEFQNTQLARPMSESETMKYMDAKISLAPVATLAPYFCMLEVDYEDWLPLCQRSIESAVSLREGASVFAMVAVDRGIITNVAAKEEIVAQLGDLGVSGYILWVDDLNEHDASLDQLRGLLDLAERLRRRAGRVINLHGSFFSVLAAGLLGDRSFTGVAHGPEFGEHRAFVPVGGGIPIARYYLPKLHQRCRYRDVVAILHVKYGRDLAAINAERFHKEICGCDACKDTLDGEVGNFTRFGEAHPREVRRGRGTARVEFPTGAAKRRCLQHYLQSKFAEYKMATEALPDDIIRDLHQVARDYRDVAGAGAVAHLSRWTKALEEVT